MRLLGENRRTVFWSFDEGPAWDFEEEADIQAEPPAPAPDWFFVVNFPRTGSTAVADVLNRHPDVFCGDEQQVMPLLMTVLHSRLMMAPDLWESVRYTKQVPVTPWRIRKLMDAWRACVSDRPLFGDKGEMYHFRFGPACRSVFPGCRFVLTVRNPLDALSSYVAQPWAAYLHLDPDRDKFFGILRDRARWMLEMNQAWRSEAVVVEFETLTDREQYVEVFTRVLEHIGADPSLHDWDAGWARCRHRDAVTRWKQDRQMLEFLDWLDHGDPELRDVLETGSYYAPTGQVPGKQVGDAREH
jgi:hypothetical protein